MSKRLEFLAWLKAQEGKTSLWAQKGPDYFDCSGLVTRGFVEIGVTTEFIPNFTNTDKLWWRLPATDKPKPGDLVFYGGSRADDVEHVMVWWGDGRVYGACGASSKILTVKEAQEKDAKVRFRKPGYRRDFRGYRRSPLDEVPNVSV